MYRAVAWFLLFAICCFTQACSITEKDVSAEAGGHSWFMYAGGHIGGSDVQRDLGYGSIASQPEFGGALSVWGNRFSASYTLLDREDRGRASGNFQFQGIPIPQT